MASVNVTFERSFLTSGVTDLYIKGVQDTLDLRNDRRYYFYVEGELTLTRSDIAGATKIALYIDNSNEDNAKFGSITDNHTQESGFIASGRAYFGESVTPSPSDYIYREDWYSRSDYCFNANLNITYFLARGEWVTNVPVFANYNDALDYINGVKQLSDAINYLSETEESGDTYNIYNTGQRGTWDDFGVHDTSSPYYRWVKIKLDNTGSNTGRIAFWRKGREDGILKLIPKITSPIIKCEYSTNGGATWQSSATFPYEYLYAERIDEMGTFIYATRTGADIPIFDNETDATGWANGDPTVDIRDAINYEDIANEDPIVNPTGTEENSTTLGDATNLKSYFSQEYICSEGIVEDISDAFFDVGQGHIWEDILEGLPMMGANPIDAIVSLKVFNFDISTILTGLQNQTFIYFGGYKFDIPNGGNVKKVLNHGGYKDLGTFTIEDAFPAGDYRNYEPFCNLKIYIPTVGVQALSYNKYRGKTITVRLYVDIKSGTTLVCLLANSVLYDFFNGSCGVDIPICLTDKAALASAQLRNISNLAGVGVNMGAFAANPNPVSGIGTAMTGADAMLGIMQTSHDQFNKTKGGSSPMGNGYFLPNYVYLIFEYIRTQETSNLRELEGRRTNKSGTLSNFSGFLSIDSIELQTTAAMSEAEKTEFISLLQSGVYI